MYFSTVPAASGLTLPILLDPRVAIHKQHAKVNAFPTAACTQQWLIGVDATIAFSNNALEHEALTNAIEAELTKVGR